MSDIAQKIDKTAIEELRISQWADAARLKSLINGLLETVDDSLIQPLTSMENMANLDDAEGFWLDCIGERLGLPRPGVLDTSFAQFGFSTLKPYVLRGSALVSAWTLTGTTPDSLATLQAITDGSLTLNGLTASGLDFSSAADLDDVASTLQAALRGAGDGLSTTEVTYDASAFVVTLPPSSDSELPITAVAAGDAADELGLDDGTIAGGRLEAIQAITAGTVTLNGLTASSLDFSAATDLDDVASTLQTALRGAGDALADIEAVYESDTRVLVITLPVSGRVAPPIDAVPTGTDATTLGLADGTIVAGSDEANLGFDQSAFSTAILALAPRVPIGDVYYRYLLKTRGAWLLSAGTVPAMETAVNHTLAGASYEDHQDMSLTLHYATTKQMLFEVARDAGAIPKPDGVSLTFMESQNG